MHIGQLLTVARSTFRGDRIVMSVLIYKHGDASQAFSATDPRKFMVIASRRQVKEKDQL